MTGRLSAQRAVVTGASRGIGRAIAVALAREGCALELVGRSRPDLASAAEACLAAGARGASTRVADLSDPSEVTTLADSLSSDGAVDVLVNNAGVLTTGHALAGDVRAWEHSFRLNVLAPMELTRRFAPGMVERGHGLIVNLGSVAAVEAMTEYGAYAATKHALRGWSRSCYQKLRAAGVKVVLINPGLVATDMTRVFEGANRERALLPEDIAEAVMLAVRTRDACCPEEITLRLTKPAFE